MSRVHSIVIDAGHGGTAAAGRSTAYGVRGPGGTAEKDVMLALAHRVAAHYGAGAVLTRVDDINLPIAARSAVAHHLGSAAFISLHANEGPPGARGAETYVHERSGAASAALAQAIQRELGVYGHAAAPVSRAAMAVLSPERLPANTAACLLEVDYLSDPYGERRLTDPAQLDRLGAAIARGLRAYTEGQQAPPVAPFTIIVGVAGLAIATFSLINALSQRDVGGLTWSRNISKVIHDYPAGKSPGEWRDCNWTLLNINCDSGLSGAYAVFNVYWRANGNDIEDCRVEKLNSNTWSSSRGVLTFEGVDASSYEENSVGCLMLHIGGTLDPSGAGDIDFNCRVLIKADGTMVNQGEFNISRGDRSDFNIRRLDTGAGYLIEKA